jgi:hypothetical protein
MTESEAHQHQGGRWHLNHSEPAEAKASSMPMNALLYDHVDLVLSLQEIPSAVAALAQGKSVHHFPKARRSSSLPVSESSIRSR